MQFMQFNLDLAWAQALIHLWQLQQPMSFKLFSLALIACRS
jgi:hypothetical protein